MSEADLDASSPSTMEGGSDSTSPTSDGPPISDTPPDGFEVPAELPWFKDDFNRADSPTLGDQWIEKNATAFDISNKRALKHALPTGTSYRDLIAYHPTPVADEQLDVEVSAIFRVLGLPVGSPQVHARVQAATVGVADTLQSYLVHIQDGSLGLTEARVARQSPTAGEYSAKLAVFTYSDKTFVVNERYRLRLRVWGTSPVNIAATLDRETAPGSGAFSPIQSATLTDPDAPLAITKPGLVGFSGDGDSDQTFAYEYFEASRLK